MPTYVYETIPQSETEPVTRFEITQSMKDAALTHHPDSGQPVRRVISGGYGIMGTGDGPSRPPSAGGGGGGCGSGCGCH
ncbi:MAG: zinc ribbon domain-containing protein [Verrucomicrobiae bacterium]|nr:zinc ribbon domain-containing protein [Verrucomicrobiae bacterium]